MESYRAIANEVAQAHGWGPVLPERIPAAAVNCAMT